MFGIGLTEMIVIGIIALVLIGPDQLPDVARTIGRFLNELRRSTDEIKDQFTQTLDVIETSKDHVNHSFDEATQDGENHANDDHHHDGPEAQQGGPHGDGEGGK